ncbi:MAG TPA: ABC transporter permease [Planctomycetota bacterium]|nr:ABC transporter permease [Planctomycetota bacterium]
MSGTWTIFRRELAGMFFGPLAWVLLCAALVLNGALFVLYVNDPSGQGDVDTALALALGDSIPYWAMMIVLPPLLTMRMISEESRSGLLEFLLTAPVSDRAVVLGKLLAATAVMALLLASSLFYGLAVTLLGAAPDWPVLLGAYGGAVLTSALFCGIGLVASAGTSTPLLAAFLAFVANIVLLLLPFLKDLAGASPENWRGAVFRRIDVISRLRGSFTMGVIDSSHVVFFLVWTAFCVFLATRLVESRRWR